MKYLDHKIPSPLVSVVFTFYILVFPACEGGEAESLTATPPFFLEKKERCSQDSLECA